MSARLLFSMSPLRSVPILEKSLPSRDHPRQSGSQRNEAILYRKKAFIPQLSPFYYGEMSLSSSALMVWRPLPGNTGPDCRPDNLMVRLRPEMLGCIRDHTGTRTNNSCIFPHPHLRQSSQPLLQLQPSRLSKDCLSPT